MGKLDIESIRKIISNYKGIVADDNGPGWDFSQIEVQGINIIGKIEPMVYYDFLEPEENAYLSLIFSMNDFITSGLKPDLSLVDFEAINFQGSDFLDYISEILSLLGRRGIKMLAAHTGSYGNIKSGVAGSMALIAVNKHPKFSLRRIRKNHKIYIIGKLGLEYEFFRDKITGNSSSSIKIQDLSIEKMIEDIEEVSSEIYYIHDLAEGGLIRALKEIEPVLNHGFNIDLLDIAKIKADCLSPSEALEASSSGAALIISSESYKPNYRYGFISIHKAESGILVNGSPYKERGDIISDLFKNQ